jgi:hypothetical protein
VAPEQLDAEVGAAGRQHPGQAALPLAMGKDLFYRQREMGIEAAYQLAGQTMAANMMDGCAQEGVTRLHREAQADWTLKALPA